MFGLPVYRRARTFVCVRARLYACVRVLVCACVRASPSAYNNYVNVERLGIFIECIKSAIIKRKLLRFTNVAYNASRQ